MAEQRRHAEVTWIHSYVALLMAGCENHKKHLGKLLQDMEDMKAAHLQRKA